MDNIGCLVRSLFKLHRKAYLAERPSLDTAIPTFGHPLKTSQNEHHCDVTDPLVQFYLAFVLVIVRRYRLFWS